MHSGRRHININNGVFFFLYSCTPSKTMRSSCRPAVLRSFSPGLLHTHVVLLLRAALRCAAPCRADPLRANATDLLVDADSADGNLPLLRKYPSAVSCPTGASFVILDWCSRIQRQKMTAAPWPFRFTAPCSRSMCAQTFFMTALLHGLPLNACCECAPAKNTR